MSCSYKDCLCTVGSSDIFSRAQNALKFLPQGDPSKRNPASFQEAFDRIAAREDDKRRKEKSGNQKDKKGRDTKAGQTAVLHQPGAVQGGGELNAYWMVMQDYFRDITQEDIHALLPQHVDPLDDPAFRIPPLGRHYTLNWNDEVAEWGGRGDAARSDRKKKGTTAPNPNLRGVARAAQVEVTVIAPRPPPPPGAEAPDEICCVCKSEEAAEGNPLVFCDGCKCIVHRNCYGIQEIPGEDDEWLCAACSHVRATGARPACHVCNRTDGALKPMADENGNVPSDLAQVQYAHLFCAHWIPELRIDNVIEMEPVLGREAIPKDRYKLKCTGCNLSGAGACIQCSVQNCRTAFHPQCAFLAGFRMELVHHSDDTYSNRAFCEKHTRAKAATDAEKRSAAGAAPAAVGGAEGVAAAAAAAAAVVTGSPMKAAGGEAAFGSGSAAVAASALSPALHCLGAGPSAAPERSQSAAPPTEDLLSQSCDDGAVALILQQIALAEGIAIAAMAREMDLPEGALTVFVEEGLAQARKALGITAKGEPPTAPVDPKTAAAARAWLRKFGAETAANDPDDQGRPRRPDPQPRSISLRARPLVDRGFGGFVPLGRDLYLHPFTKVMLEAPSGFRVETEPAVPTQVRAPADTTVQGEKEERDMGRGAEGGAGPSAAVPVDANEAGPSTRVDPLPPAAAAAPEPLLPPAALAARQLGVQALQGVDVVRLGPWQRPPDLAGPADGTPRLAAVGAPPPPTPSPLLTDRTALATLAPEDEITGEILALQSELLRVAAVNRARTAQVLNKVLADLPSQLEAAHERERAARDIDFYGALQKERRRLLKRAQREAQQREAAVAAEAALQGAAPTKYPGCDARGRNPAGELVDWLGTRHVYYATKEDADDALCAVCGEAHSEDPNVIVFCDRCDIGVHQQCYGVRDLPKENEDWLCWPCKEFETQMRDAGMPKQQIRPPRWQRPGDSPALEGGANAAACALCPVKKGAFARTTDGTQWVHVVCAKFHMETTVRWFAEHPRAVSGVAAALAERGGRTCHVCGGTAGATVQCGFGHCQAGMHPLCARNAEMYMHIRDGSARTSCKLYCDRHGHLQRAKDQRHNPAGGEGAGAGAGGGGMTAAERRAQRDRALQLVTAKEREYQLLHDVRLELEQVRLMLERVTRREKQKKALTGALREVHEARLRDVTNGVYDPGAIQAALEQAGLLGNPLALPLPQDPAALQAQAQAQILAHLGFHAPTHPPALGRTPPPPLPGGALPPLPGMLPPPPPPPMLPEVVIDLTDGAGPGPRSGVRTKRAAPKADADSDAEGPGHVGRQEKRRRVELVEQPLDFGGPIPTGRRSQRGAAQAANMMLSAHALAESLSPAESDSPQPRTLHRGRRL